MKTETRMKIISFHQLLGVEVEWTEGCALKQIVYSSYADYIYYLRSSYKLCQPLQSRLATHISKHSSNNAIIFHQVEVPFSI